MHAKRFFYLWKLEHWLQTQKETEKLRAAKKHQSQVRTTQGAQSWKKSSRETSVPMCWAQPGLNAAGKDANQGHQPAAIPRLRVEQDSGFATKKKFKATLDSVTVFPSYGNNLSWRFIFSWTFTSRRIKTGRALISVSFILLLVYSFSKEVTFYLHSVGIKSEAQKKLKISLSITVQCNRKNNISIIEAPIEYIKAVSSWNYISWHVKKKEGGKGKEKGRDGIFDSTGPWCGITNRRRSTFKPDRRHTGVTFPCLTSHTLCSHKSHLPWKRPEESHPRTLVFSLTTQRNVLQTVFSLFSQQESILVSVVSPACKVSWLIAFSVCKMRAPPQIQGFPFRKRSINIGRLACIIFKVTATCVIYFYQSSWVSQL